MVVALTKSTNEASGNDPLLPWLWSIKSALDDFNSGHEHGKDLENLLSSCITTFKGNPRYQNDPRFLKIWFLYLDSSEDYESIFREMEENKICIGQSLLYESYALFLEAKGKLKNAFIVYQSGVSRKAEPLDKLKKAQALFMDRMKAIMNACSLETVSRKIDDTEAAELGKDFVNPWSVSTIKGLLQKKDPQIRKYDGYHPSTKAYPGKGAVSSLKNSSRNKIIEIGGWKYQIKGCAGKGGFAQVFKAYVNSNPDEVVALKIQKPAFPWEFYIYRQLDRRIPEKERSSFGFAHRLHLFSDCSILVSDYLGHGTLQDAINSYAVIGVPMEEVLCIYYTIEMLYMLETIHSVGIIHGDFKPDNLLIRYAISRNDLTEEEFQDRPGPWSDQGLCLVDWGRGIDLSLFPENTEFNGDCRTSCFRCVEMQEHKPWKFQVDTYGLCVIVHMMLHNSYMEIEKRLSPDGSYIYHPKLPFKRYWNGQLWKNLFTKLLNASPDQDHISLLQNLRESFQDYMRSNPQEIKKLKQLLVKQRASLCGA